MMCRGCGGQYAVCSGQSAAGGRQSAPSDPLALPERARVRGTGMGDGYSIRNSEPAGRRSGDGNRNKELVTPWPPRTRFPSPRPSPGRRGSHHKPGARPLQCTPFQGIAHGNARHRDPRTRRGVSLMEILISIGVILGGLVGVAALLPVGRSEIVQASRMDRAAACGRAVLHEVQVRGLADPSQWVGFYDVSWYTVPTDCPADWRDTSGGTQGRTGWKTVSSAEGSFGHLRRLCCRSDVHHRLRHELHHGHATRPDETRPVSKHRTGLDDLDGASVPRIPAHGVSDYEYGCQPASRRVRSRQHVVRRPAVRASAD